MTFLNLEKKTRFYRAQRCQNPKTMSFNMLTYSPRPPANRNKTQWLTPGLKQKSYRFCDNRITKKSLKHKILNHLNNDIFEFRKKTMSFNMLTYSPPRPTANRNKTQWLTPGLKQKKSYRFCDNRIRKKKHWSWITWTMTNLEKKLVLCRLIALRPTATRPNGPEKRCQNPKF